MLSSCPQNECCGEAEDASLRLFCICFSTHRGGDRGPVPRLRRGLCSSGSPAECWVCDGLPTASEGSAQLPQGSASTGHSHLTTRGIPVGRPPGNIFQPQERRNQTLWKAAQRDPKGQSSRETWQVGGHLRNRGGASRTL